MIEVSALIIDSVGYVMIQKRIFLLQIMVLSLAFLTSICAAQGESVTHKLFPMQVNVGAPLMLTYKGREYNPPLDLSKLVNAYQPTSDKEALFIAKLIDIVNNKNAESFVDLWAGDRKAAKIYLDYPDVWAQFKDYFNTAKGFYLINKVYYGDYIVVKLMTETSDEIEQKYHFKSYVLKQEKGGLVLSSDLDEDIGVEILRFHSRYIAATMKD